MDDLRADVLRLLAAALPLVNRHGEPLPYDLADVLVAVEDPANAWWFAPRVAWSVAWWDQHLEVA